MQVICNTEDFQITEKTAVTLGKFELESIKVISVF